MHEDYFCSVIKCSETEGATLTQYTVHDCSHIIPSL